MTRFCVSSAITAARVEIEYGLVAKLRAPRSRIARCRAGTVRHVGGAVTETGIGVPSLGTSQDSPRRSAAPSSILRRFTVRNPEVSSTGEARDRCAAHAIKDYRGAPDSGADP